MHNVTTWELVFLFLSGSTFSYATHLLNDERPEGVITLLFSVIWFLAFAL